MKSIKNVKGMLSRGEMKQILGGCGASLSCSNGSIISCSGASSCSSGTGVSCLQSNGSWVNVLCPVQTN